MMTVTKKLSAGALALLFVLALVAPVAAKADGASISMETSRTITLGASEASSNISLQALMTNIPASSEDKILWETNNAGAVDFEGAASKETTGTAGSHTVTLTGKAPGRATITAKQAGTTTVLASCTVTVKKTIELSLSSAAPSSIEIGSGVSGNAGVTVNPSGYTSAYDIEWTSSDKDIVVVSGSGLSAIYAAGTKVGTATITATLKPNSSYSSVINGNSVSFQVTTTSSQPYLTLTKSPDSTFTEYDYPGTVHLTLHNNNDKFARDAKISWSVSDTSVISFSGDSALVNQEANGSFKTKKNGTATITATITGTDGSKISDSVKITVNKKLPILTLDGESHMYASRRSITLRATLDDNNTGLYDGDERIVFKSSDSKRVSITSADSHLENYKADVTVRSHYNTDNVKITAYMSNNADVSTYHTVYVTGLSYLPQTGQDSTILYIVGAVSIVMFAAAGILIAKRKRKTDA